MFIIKTTMDKARAIEHIENMPISPVQYVDIDDYKRNRTSAQNRYFHKCVKLIADHTGYTMDEVKDKIVLSVWPPVERVVYVKKDGKTQEYVLRQRRSTTELDTKEFSLLVDALNIVAHTLQIQLPMTDDYKEELREGN